MGAHMADSDSEPLVEKAQTTTAHKQSHCPFVFFRQLFREHREKREQQYRRKIDDMRGQINKSRKEIELHMKGPWQGTTSTEQRRVLWERELESTSSEHYNFGFKKCHRYKITVSNSRNKSIKIVIHDFRTPQGCEEAFRWWDEAYLSLEVGSARVFSRYEAWEEIYQEYINQHHLHQREILLRGPGEVIWLDAKVEELPN